MSSLTTKILHLLPPEGAHNLVKNLSVLLPKKGMAKKNRVLSSALKFENHNLCLENPIGLAAGFDKNAELLDLIWSLGFGYSEIGSITAEESKGNDKPRIKRLPSDKSLINWMGLPNLGAQKILLNLENPPLPIGINIAKTPVTKLSPVDDYFKSYRLLKDKGDYIVFNLSCPNTGDGRSFESPDLFEVLAKEIYSERTSKAKPHLIKISPDNDPKDIIEIANKYDFDGFVVSNTTVNRPKGFDRGGVSGKHVREKSNSQLKRCYEIVGKEKLLIGVGGIESFSDLLKKISLGASLVQIYTGLIYQGPSLIRELNQSLKNFCEKQGVKNYQDLIGNKDLIRLSVDGSSATA